MSHLHRTKISSSILTTRSGLQASYNISLMIAKQGRPHTVAEDLIRPSILEACKAANVPNAASVLANIPLSNNTVSSCICEMADDVESIVVEDLRHCRFSLPVVDSTFDNKCVVLAFACYLKGTTVCENLLFMKTVLKNTGGTIYNAIMDYLAKNGIDPLNLISICTDGAPSMIGKSQGFVARWIEFNPVFTVYCVLHRENLIAKRTGNNIFSETLDLIASAVKK
ncbi:protein ZBED8-like [Octopus bimaculoides]|uniref:protein ZBED8-like n=1 Tax=Octopus bimaculoides TaxID=37653 RepID=UPI00071DE653|nr:protein ZBED8-like [Octopus bimaculoides]|eukprot:XP_014788751.1 PREDICTED: protein ZBED8-like [Octopus bimaculoides]